MLCLVLSQLLKVWPAKQPELSRMQREQLLEQRVTYLQLGTYPIAVPNTASLPITVPNDGSATGSLPSLF